MPPKILIVDDDVDGLKLISLMLQRHGYEVVAANAGSQAISRAHIEMPDLIILDVMMPDMNGYEVCRRLRADAETQAIPIIMFTAKTLIDDKVAGFEAGADDYLTKPTHPAELASRVKTILERSTQRNHKVDRGEVIGVIGIKGGLGATTLTLNLGAAFQQMDDNPIIADFQLGRGTMGLYMGLRHTYGMSTTLRRSIEDITPNVLEQEIILHRSGLRALLSSCRPSEALLNYSLESAVAVVRGLRTLGKPVIIDLGSGFSRLIYRLQDEIDRLIVLIDSNEAVLPVAGELLREFTNGRPSEEISLVAMNHEEKQNRVPWPRIEQALEHEIRAVISSDPALAAEALSKGTPMVNQQPNAVVASQLMKLAEYLHVAGRSAVGESKN